MQLKEQLKILDQFPHFEEVVLASGFTASISQQILGKIFADYSLLAEPIPMGSASEKWKLGKPAHAREAADEVASFAEILGLSPAVVLFIAIACAAHDLGRMVQANYRVGTRADGLDLVFDPKQRAVPYSDDDTQHGYESMVLLRRILGDLADTEAGRWLLDAVLHHSLIDNPTVDMCSGRAESLYVCLVVHDIDKECAFTEVRDYTRNPKRIALELDQNWPDQVNRIPEWGWLNGEIRPVCFLNVPFEQLIKRAECENYITYLWQFLKWYPGFSSRTMQIIALSKGGPQELAATILMYLQRDSPEQYSEVLHQLEAYNGGELLRPYVPQAA